MSEQDRLAYLDDRIPRLHAMLKELVSERAELRRRRMDAYLNELDGCNPNRAEVIRHD